MLVFVSIAFAGLLFIVGSHMFGDHDTDHDHDIGHEAGENDGPTVSIFSMKVISTFVMSFGAGGAIARYYDLSYPISSFAGAGTGVIFAIMFWIVLRLIYKQQGSSVVESSDAVGQTGTIITPIDQDAVGEVALTVKGCYRTFMACSHNGKAIEKGKMVTIQSAVGGKLTVKEA